MNWSRVKAILAKDLREVSSNKMVLLPMVVVENMAYLYIAEYDKKIELFGRSRGKELAEASDAPLLGQLPIDPELAKLCDEGDIERYDGDIVDSLGESLLKAISAKKG